MRGAALAALIVGSLVANQAHARDVSSQPLTQVCDQAGMAWDDAANVCGSAPLTAEARPEAQAAQTVPTSDGPDSSSQPLMRHGCDRVGMAWDDTTNVCSTEATAIQLEPEPEAVAPTVLVNINKSNQTMTVDLDGVQHYEWPVSTGLHST